MENNVCKTLHFQPWEIIQALKLRQFSRKVGKKSRSLFHFKLEMSIFSPFFLRENGIIFYCYSLLKTIIPFLRKKISKKKG